MKLKEDDTIIKSLRNCPLFTGFGRSELKSVLSIAHIRDYSDGEVIFSEGNLGLCFYIIVKGSAEIAALSKSGNNGTLKKRVYTEGSYFSETHLFTESSHSVSCTAREVTKLIIFAKPDLEDLIKIKPRLGNKVLLRFLEFLSEQLNSLYKENLQLLQKDN